MPDSLPSAGVEYTRHVVLFDGLVRVTQVIVVDVPADVEAESEEFEKLAHAKLSADGWLVDAMDDVGDVELQEHYEVFPDVSAVAPKSH